MSKADSRRFRQRIQPSGGSVRRFGIVLASLSLVEGALGVASAGETVSRLNGLLGLHLALGAGLGGLMVWALLVAARETDRRAFKMALGTAAAMAATGATGAYFLLTGNVAESLLDRGLAGLTVVGALSMIAWGG